MGNCTLHRELYCQYRPGVNWEVIWGSKKYISPDIRKKKWALYFSVMGERIKILLNLFMIPRSVAVGARVAILITYYMVTVLRFISWNIEK